MPLSEARKRANAKYTAKAYQPLQLRVKMGERELIQGYSEQQGMTLNNFCTSCIRYCIKHGIDVSAVPALTETLPDEGSD